MFFIQIIQVCDKKIGRPSKIAGNLTGPKNKNSGNFAKSPQNGSKIYQHRQIGFGQISNPKKEDELPCLNFDMGPPPGG